MNKISFVCAEDQWNELVCNKQHLTPL